jgi:hypothetical protein
MHRSAFLAVAFGLAALFASVQGATAQDRRWETDILRDTFGYGANTPSDVPWDEVQQGCGRTDCIPSIDAPRFVAAGRAGFLAEDDLVLGIVVNGDARALAQPRPGRATGCRASPRGNRLRDWRGGASLPRTGRSAPVQTFPSAS